ncbi:hypothetical protein DAEQUDRAFT_768316 [Daedalea quercina L-15889]|uniref:Uncharacterized protein n=1 Tax=Daedalea quercina L-15889 TaxID=1314783 RepID=A0A165MSF2_9APHY|nr:hypothetical protein DAEQUDRAFT_768316 [Daedalea quercina L-15889]
MRFLKLFAEASVGVGTLLSTYCPEPGATSPKHAAGLNIACDVWGKAVDVIFSPVGHSFYGTKDGSLAGWDGGLLRKWRTGLLATSDDSWSSDLSFVNTSTTIGIGNGILDTGGTPGGDPLASGSTQTTSIEYTGTKDIILAPCIICSALRDPPQTTPSDASATMAAGKDDVEPEPLVNSADVEKMLVFFAFAIVFWVSHIWIMLNAAQRTVIDTHVIPFVRKWIARPLFSFMEYVGWFTFGQPIAWDPEWKDFIVVTKDGTYRSMAFLSMTDFILLDGTPVADDEDTYINMTDVPVERVINVEDVPVERESPAPVWNRDMHVSTSGPRQTRRGQKKAAKKAKGKKQRG